MQLAPRRLSGIQVGVTPRPAAEALPRMDVAVLVGFASTGPVDTPVAVESVARFTEVFGADASLAWDDLRGERVYAYLGPAVRAFFANGGRRCWIIRVARAPIANTFAVPGVLEVAMDGAVEASAVTARSEGSWSDGLRVATALQTRSFTVEGISVSSSPSRPTESLFFSTRFRLVAGDLIELDDGDRSAFAAITTVAAAPDGDGLYDVEAEVCAAFERLVDGGSPSSSPHGWPGTAEVRGLGGPIAANLIAPANPPSRLPFDAPLPAELTFNAPVAARLERGQWVRWFDSGARVWLRIDVIEEAIPLADSPPGLVLATVHGPAWREVDALSLSLAGVTRGRVVSLELRVDSDGSEVAHLAGIGLTPSHPAAWWNQATDAEFYAAADDRDDRELPASPRVRQPFPLARASRPAPRAWVPLGVTALFGSFLSRLPTTPASLTALERDGLARFDADLFLDPELADVPVQGVEAVANAIRFVRDDTRPLRGLHAAWSLGAGGLFNEGSLLAIPDAIHLGWHRRPDEPIPAAEPRDPLSPPHWHTHRGACAKPIDRPIDGPDFGTFLDCATRALIAPTLEGPTKSVAPGVYRLTWDDSEPQGTYVLVEYTQADLSDPREIDSGRETEYIALTLREGVYYYQVFARVGDERSDGSNVVGVRVRGDDWVQNRPGHEVEHDRALLAVHRAALRMAAASGDLFVALAMPRHYRSAEAIRYAQRLRQVRQPPGQADADAFGFTEARALSYGALYFPWLQSGVRAADGGAARSRTPQVVPPDGVALGVLAARASNRGAWIAPANEPIRDVVAVTPPVRAGEWQPLLDAQINLVRADPRGFLTLAADTLADDVAVRPINVRRLLILLRRLALRRGVSYVFEPNGPALRRAVQRGFELLLTDLFQRGAFAGSVPDDSFRVVTDGTINNPADADAGRFFVELRVAPSLPMRFIAVRLAQSGPRLTVSEEL